MFGIGPIGWYIYFEFPCIFLKVRKGFLGLSCRHNLLQFSIGRVVVHTLAAIATDQFDVAYGIDYIFQLSGEHLEFLEGVKVFAAVKSTIS